MKKNLISAFHAHIYFNSADSRDAADVLQKKLAQFQSKLIHYGKLIDRAIGPHPVPMFEIDFGGEIFAEVVSFLMLNHGDLSVLIHPETGNDLKDHTLHALWLGSPLALKLESLG